MQNKLSMKDRDNLEVAMDIEVVVDLEAVMAEDGEIIPRQKKVHLKNSEAIVEVTSGKKLHGLD